MSELANSIREMRELAKAWRTGAPHQQSQAVHLDAVCDAAERSTIAQTPSQHPSPPAMLGKGVGAVDDLDLDDLPEEELERLTAPAADPTNDKEPSQ